MVLNARTISPGHFLRFSSHSRITAEALVRIDEASVFRDRSKTISVAISRQSGSAVFPHHYVLQHGEMRQNRLGVDSREQRIQLSAKFDVIDPALGEDAFEHTAPGPVHHVDGKLESGFLNRVRSTNFLMAAMYGVLKSVTVTLPPLRSRRGESNSPSMAS